jgi:hypothetical protein
MQSVRNCIDMAIYGCHTVVPNISKIGLEIEFAYKHMQKENLIGQRNSVIMLKLDAIG